MNLDARLPASRRGPPPPNRFGHDPSSDDIRWHHPPETSRISEPVAVPCDVSLIADVCAAEAAVHGLIDLDVATYDPSMSPQLKRG